MRLERLRIQRAPGLPGGLPTLDLGPGLTLIVGPNASGKSTIARTLSAMLWPDEVASDASADCDWHIGGTTHEARLFARRVTWQPPPEGSAPRGAAALARFGIKSLLDADDAADRNVAAELAQELAGGFDLTAARASFDTPPRYRSLSREARTYKEAARELAQAKRSSDALEQREGRLAAVDAEIEAARQAQGAAEAAGLLTEVLAARTALASLEEASDRFPEALEGLTGREADELRELEATLETARRELAAAEAERGDHAQRCIELEDGHTLPDGTTLETWEARIERLRELEREAREQRAGLRGAEAAHRSARERLQAPDEHTTDPLDSAHLEGLGEAIRKWRAALERREATEHTAGLWASWSGSTSNSGAEAVDAEGGLRALRLWLRSPMAIHAAPTPAAALRSLRPLAFGALLLGLIGGLCALFVPSETLEVPSATGFALLAGVGLVLLLLQRRDSQSAPSAPPPEDERQAAQRAAKQAGLNLGEWSEASVEKALTELEGQRDAERSAERLSERAKAQVAALDGDLQRARAAEDEQRTALCERAQAAGIGEPWLDLGAAAQVEALVALGRAQDDEAAARARLTELDAEQQTLLDAAAAWLHGLGRLAPVDAAALAAEHAALAERGRELARTRDLLRQAERAAERLARQVDEQATKSTQLWQRTGLEAGNWVVLEALMPQLEDWQTHSQAKRDAAGELDSLRRRFAHSAGREQFVRLLPEGQEPEDVEPTTAAAWMVEQAGHASQLTALIDERGRIRNSLDEASSGQQLADAIAAVRVAAEGIAIERTAAAADAMSRTLIHAAARQQQADHTPQLLQRAQDYFGRFTDQAWRIELSSSRETELGGNQAGTLGQGVESEHGTGSGQGFVAVEVATNRRRRLDELSDGTRVQLLLAARLAALESREDGERVPICLDEALSTTDPQRFRAIAAAFFELACDEATPRQVLYFTADMGEAEQWKLVARELGRPEPSVIDLGRLRGEPADWGGELAPQPDAPEPLPSPAGQTPDEYATVLGVARPDGFAEPANWHLFTLAFDDLPALATCVRWQLPTLGTWRAARDADRLPPELDDESTRRFGLRLELAEALARLWRLGRGRPVTWSDIEASDAVSKTFEDRVRAILEIEHRRPRAFVKKLSELQRFKKQAGKLEAHLIDCGALPTEDPFEPDELQRRTLAAAQPAATELGIDEASTYTRWLASLLSQ